MQPLDLTFYGPLKNAYNKECESYMMNHPGQKITAFEIVALFTKAFNRTANVEKAVNGFRAAGIYPFDSGKFDELFEKLIPTIEEPAIGFNPITSTSRDTNSQSNNAQFVPDTSHIDSILVQNNQNDSVTLSNLNVPVIPVKAESRKKKHSEILTSTPNKKKLEEKNQKKESKIEEEEIKEQETIKKKRKCNEKENMPFNKKLKIKKSKSKEPKIKKEKIKKEKKPNMKKAKCVRNLKEFGKSNNKEDEYFCIFCNEKYVSPPTEDWIMCLLCLKWAHEGCTSGSSSKGYVCDICRNI